MTKKKAALFPVLILAMTLCSFGQKLKYKDCKNDFSLKNYKLQIKDPKYSPLLAGVGNYLFPSAGYFYIGEPLRGACVFGGEMITTGIFLYGFVGIMAVNPETGNSQKGAGALMLTGLIGSGIIWTWSIYDVVRIAKIKNLAFQNQKITLNLKPNLDMGSQKNKNFPVYGLRLSVDF